MFVCTLEKNVPATLVTICLGNASCRGRSSVLDKGSQRVVQILLLAVRRRFRRRGYGQKLMQVLFVFFVVVLVYWLATRLNYAL